MTELCQFFHGELAGHTVEGHAGHGVAHILTGGVLASLLDGLLDHVDGVVAQSGERVRLGVVSWTCRT